MSHNTCEPYVLCINVQIFRVYRMWRIIHWYWCVLSVCLSHCISQFIDIYRKGQNFQNTRGQMRQWMTFWLARCSIYCAWLIHLSAKLKEQPKNEMQLWLYRKFHHQKKGRQKQGFCLFPKFRLCNVQLIAVWTYSYVTLFTALIPAEHRLPCVDEECSNMDCVSNVFRTATLRTHNYNIHVCR